MRFVLAVPLLLNCESQSAAFVIPVSRPLPVTLYARNDNSSSSNRDTTIASQAALIAGTTIGGGFLALPASTSPCGAAPAAVGLVGVWLFLLGGALSLSNAIFMLKRNSPQSWGRTRQCVVILTCACMLWKCSRNICGFRFFTADQSHSRCTTI